MATDILEKLKARFDGAPSAACTVVLGHGFGTDQGVWDGVCAGLDDLVAGGRLRVLRYDLIGCGSGDQPHFDPQRYDSLHAYAADLIALLDAAGWRRCTYVGHSVSGMVGVLAALRRPELFEQLILVGASARYLDDPESGYVGGLNEAALQDILAMMTRDFQAWAAGFAPVMVEQPEHPAFADYLRRSLEAMRPDIARQLAHTIFASDHRACLSQVATPTVVVQTRSDAAVPRAAAEYLAAHLPDARLHLIDTTGHLPHLTSPPLVAKVLREHLAPRAVPVA